MKRLTLYSYSGLIFYHYPKRIVSGVLLILLLVMQAKIMLEGCLIMPYLPHQQSMEAMAGSCAEPASPGERVCLANCEYSISKPKLAGEITLFDIIVELPTIMFMMALSLSFSPDTSYTAFVPVIGPPLYLLFLRLFIPTHPLNIN